MNVHFKHFFHPITNAIHSSAIAKSISVISNSISVPSMATTATNEEVLPPFQGSNSEPPSVFDGTTRLYTTYYCPFAQRAWLARNFKGLQDKIELVAIDLDDRPVWYREKVYPPNKVPALEHNNEVIGESLDLIKYIDAHFEGPSLFPEDPEKKEFTDELFEFSGKWSGPLWFYLMGKASDTELNEALDKLEAYFEKYNHEGPFFLGAKFSAADVVYAPFVQRHHPLYLDLHNYDITEGRPKLAAWMKALETVEAFRQTKWDQEQNIKIYKRRNLGIV